MRTIWLARVAWLVAVPVLSITPLAAAQSAAPAAAGAGGPSSATIGNVEVTVDSANVDHINLKGREQGLQGGTSEGKVLIVKIKLYNKGTATVTYHSYNGIKADKKATHASMTDAAHKYVTLVDFDKYEPADAVHDAQIAAGQTISDVMAFAIPPSTEGNFTLFLPQANLGGTGAKPGYIMFTVSGQ